MKDPVGEPVGEVERGEVERRGERLAAFPPRMPSLAEISSSTSIECRLLRAASCLPPPGLWSLRALVGPFAIAGDASPRALAGGLSSFRALPLLPAPRSFGGLRFGTGLRDLRKPPPPLLPFAPGL